MDDCYVYVHRRANDGRIFYVGRGRGRRAWDENNRTQKWWNEVIANRHTVEIIADRLESHEAVIKECQFTSVYGELGEPLVNKAMVLKRRNVRNIGRLDSNGEPCYCFRLITMPFRICATIDEMVREQDADWDEINQLVDGEIAVSDNGWIINEK